jgi:hypothetical protein
MTMTAFASEKRKRHRLALRERRRGSATIGLALERCAKACADTYRAYRLARWSAEDELLRPMFDRLTRERDQFLTVLCQLGGPAEARGTTAATVRRVALEAALIVRRNDRLLIAECLHAERLAERAYARERAALSDPQVDVARQALTEQELAISRARAQLERALCSATRWLPV